MIQGWDNAPLVKLGRFEIPRHVTIVMPYYCNPAFLMTQITKWSFLPQSIRDCLSAVIVDDGSPSIVSAEEILKGFNLPFPIRLFKIEVDVRWNWLAARNLAMYHVYGWVVATDIDHVIPLETFETLQYGKVDHQFIYRFSRIEHTGEKIHSHPNSWFMTRGMFWKFGGYDEALSGYYGTDGEARRRWVKTAPVYTLPDVLVRFERQGDSSTIRYERKQPIDLKAQAIIKARGKDWKPKVLSFPYHEIVI